MAFFEGLVETEEGLPVEAKSVGGTSYYVIDDHGFYRHIEALGVDRAVMAQFMEQVQEHRGEASEMVLRMMGQDDLFTKAMVDSTIRNLSVDQLISQQLPSEAREWLGVMGFRIIIDLHGGLVRLDMPAASEDWDSE